MSEITFGGGGDDSEKSGGGGDIVDSFKEMVQFVKENPEVAKMMGYDVGQLNNEVAETMDNASNTDGEGGIGVDELMGVTQSLIEAGFGDKTINQVHHYMEANTDEVSQLIEQRT